LCHSTTAWIPSTFDHTAVTGSCSSCHNGTTATGKTPTHIVTTAECDACHTTTAWIPASFDHSSVTGSCSSCHNGTTATGKTPTHIITTAECDTCHSTTAWTPASFNHDAVTGSCSSCHNGVSATGKSPTHFVTSLQCDECHNTTAWLPTIPYRHSSASYPGDHRASVTCINCHTTNSESVTWRFPAYQPDCAGCHANRYEQDAHKKVDTPTIFYTVSELRDCSGACHMYTDSTFTTIARSRSGHHHASDGGW